MPNPYAKPRTSDMESHSAKPHPIQSLTKKDPWRATHQTRRSTALHNTQATIRKGLTHHRNDKRRGEYHGHIYGGRRRTRRGRKTRSTRRR
jgi:hypothetical protein